MGRGEPIGVTLGVVDLDPIRRRVRVGAREVALTGLEATLLGYLAARPDTDVSRSELLSEVWGYAPSSATRAVDFVVSRLRAKLGDECPIRLLTIHGVGYRLVIRNGVTPGSAVRLPSGVVDAEGGRFVPDRGDPIPLGGEEVALLLRLVGGS